MMHSKMDELLILSRLFPDWIWATAKTRQVIIAADDEGVLRLYWKPALLCIDEHCAELFMKQLNRRIE